jgi:predicted RNA-binding Zn ribbon-like protein
VGMSPTAPAPGRLEVVRAFVNTLNVERRTDTLSSPWERTVREAIRSALAANHDRSTVPPTDLRVLDEAAERVGLSVRFAADSSFALRPTRRGRVGEVLVAMTSAMSDGTWSRLKVCADDECLWAFYDNSRARTGQWCSMEVCGNRAKQKAWRDRGGRA